MFSLAATSAPERQPARRAMCRDVNSFGWGLFRNAEFEYRTGGSTCQPSPGISPMAIRLHAIIGSIPSSRARSTSAGLSAPGLTQTSGMPFSAISASTPSPSPGGK